VPAGAARNRNGFITRDKVATGEGTALMTLQVAAMRELRDVDVATFQNEILPRNEPVVFRGLVARWPAVQEGLKSPQALSQYLTRFDAGATVKTLIGSPAIKGRFFYKDDMSGLNFDRTQEPFGKALERLLAHLDDSEPPAIAIQAAAVADYLPAFAAANANPLLDASVGPRIWIGNRITVATHFDPVENIACVVAGRRRFTLFPPDQVSNLYIGPFELTPAGAPVSMVSVVAPEFDRYPRFREALATAQSTELEPGDAIYIPYLWWHHVESLERFNILVNYWWNPGAPAGLGAPFDSLFHGMLALSALPENQRKAWRAMFDHYVFRLTGEPGDHLPPQQRGLLSPMTPELAKQMKAMLKATLNR
jgi:hypothetical protein